VNNSSNMTMRDVETHFNEINEKFAQRNEQGRMIIVGGVALGLVHNARDMTHDIDALYTPKKMFNDIIKEISQERQTGTDWLNDGMKGFLTDNMPYFKIRHYSNLQVFCIETEPLLAMKLVAARLDTQDMNDAKLLMKKLHISKVEQLYELVEKYMPKNLHTPKADFFIQQAFDEYRISKEKGKSNRTKGIKL
jgi:hypothetical protein